MSLCLFYFSLIRSGGRAPWLTRVTPVQVYSANGTVGWPNLAEMVLYGHFTLLTCV